MHLLSLLLSLLKTFGLWPAVCHELMHSFQYSNTFTLIIRVLFNFFLHDNLLSQIIALCLLPSIHHHLSGSSRNIYNIELGLFEELQKDIVIQLNPISQDKFIHLQLTTSLHRDSDLAPIKCNRIMQTLFILSGCDYISYVRSIGKNTFL